MDNNIFIARQPIYDKDLNVIAYELLYRDSTVNQAMFNDDSQASSELITNVFMHIGVDQITGSALAFINIPQDFILNQQRTPMFAEQTVLEILESVQPEPEVIQGLKNLKQVGYRLALDDFRHQDKLQAFASLADFIKLDILDFTTQELEQQVNILRRQNVRLIAEKVETREQFEQCQTLGFDYFQGFFFCHPQIMEKKHIPANKLVILKLLSAINSPDTSTQQFESILAQDVTLSYKLLRYINSAMFSLRREINSIQDAVLLLGLNTIKSWASLLLMSGLSENKPHELIVTGMIRARMCEGIAATLVPAIKHQMFIVGLFSVLDALMDTPMAELLDNLVLTTPIKMALLDHAGNHGALLEQVIWYEQGKWGELMRINVDVELFLENYINAVKWTDENIQSLLQK